MTTEAGEKQLAALEKLPNELLLKIMAYKSLRVLAHLRTVSRRLSPVATQVYFRLKSYMSLFGKSRGCSPRFINLFSDPKVDFKLLSERVENMFIDCNQINQYLLPTPEPSRIQSGVPAQSQTLGQNLSTFLCNLRHPKVRYLDRSQLKYAGISSSPNDCSFLNILGRLHKAQSMKLLLYLSGRYLPQQMVSMPTGVLQSLWITGQSDLHSLLHILGAAAPSLKTLTICSYILNCDKWRTVLLKALAIPGLNTLDVYVLSTSVPGRKGHYFDRASAEDVTSCGPESWVLQANEELCGNWNHTWLKTQD